MISHYDVRTCRADFAGTDHQRDVCIEVETVAGDHFIFHLAHPLTAILVLADLLMIAQRHKPKASQPRVSSLQNLTALAAARDHSEQLVAASLS